MILNFGHTAGHAIEAAGGFGGILHGEAIAWGMIVALRISRLRGWLKREDEERAVRLILQFNPPPPPSFAAQRLLDLAAKDKKNSGRVRRFVLLRGIGKAVVTEDVTDAELLESLDAVLLRKRRGRLP
jgi:3-dehydroquinate synthase